MESELEETKRRSEWLTALISKSTLSPLLLNHKGVRNDFFPSKTLLHHLLHTSPLPSTPSPSTLLQSQSTVRLKLEPNQSGGRSSQSLQLLLQLQSSIIFV